MTYKLELETVPFTGIVYFLSADLKSTYDRIYYLVKYMNSNVKETY